MLNYVQVLTTPTADTPGTALVLKFDDKSYIFGNVGEGAQRAAGQQKVGLLKVQNIFLTGKTTWRTTGGLLGLILTVADGFASANANIAAAPVKKGKKPSPPRRMEIHGTDNLMHTIATARRFVFRKGMPLDIYEAEERPADADISTPSWSDNNIKVWHMDISDKPMSRTSRKRSHEVMSEGDSDAFTIGGSGSLTPEQNEDRLQQIRKGVVSHMFDSNWHLDTLNTMSLSQVRLPATIFVRNGEGKFEKYVGPMANDGGDPDLQVHVRAPWPAALIEDLPQTSPSAAARSYIVKNHNIRGKFLAKDAKDLGVVPPQFKMLTSGQTITTADGKVVTPNMVMEPERVGGSFAVVELPTRDYIESLLAREEWGSKAIMEGMGAIFWILGQGVMGDERLANFMAKMSHLEHIVSSDDSPSNCLTFESAAKAQLRLHLIDPERFPQLAYSNAKPDLPAGLIPAQVGLKFQLEPKMERQEAEIVKYIDGEKAIEEALGINGATSEASVEVGNKAAGKEDFDGLVPEVAELAEAARKRINQPEYLADLEKLQQDLPWKDAEIIPLGTGSALPSKYRNVSATLVRVPGVGNYLFDCGENTLGQLKRVFGPEIREVLRDLKVLWISHLHADHHLGTASVLRARNDLDRASGFTFDKLIVASDDGLHQWLKEYAQVEDVGFKNLQQFALNESNNWRKEFTQEETAMNGLSAIVACQVSHCKGALAVVLKFPNGFSVAFSGDCRPSYKFAEIARGATVLIHEATFETGMEGDALAKKHCTTSEALWVAKKMNAKRVMLTHFSQRYPKVSSMDDTGGAIAISAFDYMRCRVGDFAKVSEFNKAIEKLYAEEDPEEVAEMAEPKVQVKKAKKPLVTNDVQA